MPTPSLGYSLVIVLGRAIVLRSIRERLADTPISLSVGAEMQFDFVIAGNQVTAHGIVYKYEFTIGSPQGGQAISIGLDIQEVSVRASGRVLCPLAVRLTAEIPVALEQIDLYSRGALRLDRAAVTLNLDEASTLKVASFGLAVQDVESAAAKAIRDMLRAQGSQPFTGNFVISPGEEGQLDPLVFSKAGVVCAWRSDPEWQSIVIGGTLLPEHDDYAELEKLRRIAVGGQENVAVVLNTDAFNRLILCPRIEEAFTGSRAGECGEGGQVQLDPGLPPLEISTVRSSFWNRISTRIDGSISHWAGTIAVRMIAQTLPVLKSGKLSFETHVGKPWVSLSPAPGVVAVLEVIFTPAVLILLQDALPRAASVLEEFASTKLGHLVPQMLRSTSFMPSDLDSVYWKRVGVNSQSFSISGSVEFDEPSPSSRVASIKEHAFDLERRTIKTGYENVLLCGPDVSVPFTEQLIKKEITLSVLTQGYGHPVTVQWELEDNSGNRVELSSPTGVFQMVDTQSSFSWPEGYSTSRVPAAVTWRILGEGSVLRLGNNPNDGNYILMARAHVSNCSGSINTTLVQQVVFEGHVIESAADSLARKCVRDLMVKYGLFAPAEVPVIGPPIDPVLIPANLAKLQLRLIRTEDAELVELASNLGVIAPPRFIDMIDRDYVYRPEDDVTERLQ